MAEAAQQAGGLIAVLCPVHHGAAGVRAQVENYNRFFGARCVHVLHPSQDSAAEYAALPAGYFPANVRLNPDAWPTSHRCTMGALLSNTLFLDRLPDRDRVGHVYIHSDSDLIVWGDAAGYVDRNGVAFSAGPLSEGWVHRARMMADARFAALRAELGIDAGAIVFGRQEGAFFPRALWDWIVARTLRHYDREFFAVHAGTWPLEEGLVPTLAAHRLGRTHAARVVVRTKPARARVAGTPQRRIEENLVQAVDIDALLGQAREGECLAMKWFSRDLDHPARRHLAHITRSDPA